MAKRSKKKKRAQSILGKYLSKIKCPNCGGDGPHFVPPSMGEPGFFTCTPDGERKDKDGDNT